MKKLFLLLIFLLMHSSIFSQKKDLVQELIDQGIFEEQSMSFISVSGSNEYIKQFQLNQEEISLIGFWDLDRYSRTITNDNVGLGISIKFLPNRYLVARKAIRDVGMIEYIIGEWRVSQGQLEIRLLSRFVKLHENTGDLAKMYRIDTKDTLSYFPIFRIQKYERVYVNDLPFSFARIPKPFLDFYGITDNDAPRFRVLFDNIGIPPGNINPDSKWGKILLKPVISDQYFLQLITVWQ